VLDDHLMMWGLDPTKDAVRMMPTTSWKGRWPQPDRDDNEEDEQDAALAALAAQDAAEAAATSTATGYSGLCGTAPASQKQLPPVPAVSYISSPRPAVKPLPVRPQGLTVLLPEVLKLVAKVRRPFSWQRFPLFWLAGVGCQHRAKVFVRLPGCCHALPAFQQCSMSPASMRRCHEYNPVQHCHFK
jgi:hypothetical protein